MKNLISILFFATIAMTANSQNFCPNFFKCGDTLVDTRDGRHYPTLLLGTQCWFKINLYATKYMNGDPIPNVNDNSTWANLSSGAWCDNDNFGNQDTNGIKYGHLYNYYTAIDSRGLCPKGWFVPTYDEWQILSNYLGGPTNAGAAMKAGPGLSLGDPGTNSSGFTALPGGYRCGGQYFWCCWNSSYYGTYTYLGYDADFIIPSFYGGDATQSTICTIDYVDVPSLLFGSTPKTIGASVRCMKDN